MYWGLVVIKSGAELQLEKILPLVKIWQMAAKETRKRERDMYLKLFSRQGLKGTLVGKALGEQ